MPTCSKIDWFPTLGSRGLIEADGEPKLLRPDASRRHVSEEIQDYRWDWCHHIEGLHAGTLDCPFYTL